MGVEACLELVLNQNFFSLWKDFFLLYLEFCCSFNQTHSKAFKTSHMNHDSGLLAIFLAVYHSLESVLYIH